MANAKRVLFVGLDPRVVDFGKYPGLSPENLRAALDADKAKLAALGCEVDICFTDRGETAGRVLADALAAKPYVCVMIGAGVRTDPETFLLFETVVNVVHQHAPAAKICFNTNPADSAAAVQRWV
jgi:hypothetical protein